MISSQHLNPPPTFSRPGSPPLSCATYDSGESSAVSGYGEVLSNGPLAAKFGAHAELLAPPSLDDITEEPSSYKSANSSFASGRSPSASTRPTSPEPQLVSIHSNHSIPNLASFSLGSPLRRSSSKQPPKTPEQQKPSNMSQAMSECEDMSISTSELNYNPSSSSLRSHSSFFRTARPVAPEPQACSPRVVRLAPSTVGSAAPSHGTDATGNPDALHGAPVTDPTHNPVSRPLQNPQLSTFIKGLPTPIVHRNRQYEFDFLVGVGSFGRVFRARAVDKTTGIESVLAIKVVHKAPMDTALNWGYGDDDLSGRDVQWSTTHATRNEALVREVQVLRDVKKAHSRFLSVLSDVWQDNWFVYLAIPLGNQSLHERLNQLRSERVKMPRDELEQHAAQLLLAIENLHSLGWYHHDIKPDNIMLSGVGNIILGDFGCAQRGFKDAHGLREFGAHEILGANGCHPPELKRLKAQLESLPGRKLTYHAEYADIWNFGLVLYEMHSCPYRLPYPVPDELYSDMAMVMNRMNKHARDLIFEKLLCDDETQRACLEEVKRHPFFALVDWASIAAKKVDMSYLPNRPHPPAEAPPNLRVAPHEMKDTAFYLNHDIKLAAYSNSVIDLRTLKF
ncbi:kinase-like protein [Cylindrobasidium torrendii FP15055 ss-10]|uniref:Kinase-like protein n=1 Tax=Cylindrobasidium torrendii FP15055 ss-10 TaxID=1314674 RepID=A0A0D7B695_9AGAR|nr:kinase-like protein [Cylindrobasidium torrendii FP15055 ss-10]